MKINKTFVSLIIILSNLAACKPKLVQSETKIAEGTEVTSGKLLSSTVAVFRPKGICSGVVIGKQVILTAAHCVPGFDLYAHSRGKHVDELDADSEKNRLAMHVSFGPNIRSEQARKLKVLDMRVHPFRVENAKTFKNEVKLNRFFNGVPPKTSSDKNKDFVALVDAFMRNTRTDRDLAVLKVEEFGESLTPVAVALGEYKHPNRVSIPNGVVAGYGVSWPGNKDTGVLKSKNVSKIEISGFRGLSQYFYEGVGTQAGDSGGPLFEKRGDSLILLGVAALTIYPSDDENRNASKDAMHFYSSPAGDRKWIEDSIRDFGLDTKIEWKEVLE